MGNTTHAADFGKTINIGEDESLPPGKAAFGGGSEEVAQPPLPALRDSFQSPQRSHTDILRRLVKHCGRYRPDL